MLNLEYSNTSKKFLKNADKSLAERIVQRIFELQQNPYPPGRKKVEGRKEVVYRVRVGGYRILYVILKEKSILLISDIDKRESVYD